MIMTVFWDVAPCSLVEVDLSEVLTASFIIRSIALMMEAIITSETSAYFYEITCCNPEDCQLQLLYFNLYVFR
jgi:hypothetical protein